MAGDELTGLGLGLDLVYEAGSEHDPGDSRGRDTLVVHADDTFSLENRFAGDLEAWEGTLEAGTAARLVQLLDAAGFPAVPRHDIPGGSAMRRLARGSSTAYVAWHAARDLPGYAEVFALIDAIVGATMAAPGAPAAPVADLHMVEGPGED